MPNEVLKCTLSDIVFYSRSEIQSQNFFETQPVLKKQLKDSQLFFLDFVPALYLFKKKLSLNSRTAIKMYPKLPKMNA